MIRLGSKVKDHYTGFEGLASGRSDWLYRRSRRPTGLRPGMATGLSSPQARTNESSSSPCF